MKWNTQSVQTTVDSPLGKLRLCASPSGLAGIWFHDQRHLPEDAHFAQWPNLAAEQHPTLDAATEWLNAYFAGVIKPWNQPLDMAAGTSFQQSVWTTLMAIPAGSTLSYGQVALAIGRPAAVRAVGAAVGRNPLSILVPCHRVMGANGALTGYAGGLERKKALLKLEGALK